MLTPRSVTPIVDGRVVSFDPVVPVVRPHLHLHNRTGPVGWCPECQRVTADRLRQQNEDAADAARRWMDTVH